MPNSRLSMRQIREMMRLHYECGWSKREVARAMKMSATAVWEYLQRAKRIQLTYERARELDDGALEQLLFPLVLPSKAKRPMPNWSQIHRELGRKTQWAKTDILVMDDLAMTPLTDSARRDLLEILDDRHGKRSTIATSQIPVNDWHAALADPTLADAILDRLVHNAHRITMDGESMRKPENGLTSQPDSE